MRVSTMVGGRQCLLVLVAGLLLLGVEVGEVHAGALVVREAEAESAASRAVPVIHLNDGKASVDEYLKLFPEQLLGNHQNRMFSIVAVKARQGFFSKNKMYILFQHQIRE